MIFVMYKTETTILQYFLLERVQDARVAKKYMKLDNPVTDTKINIRSDI